MSNIDARDREIKARAAELKTRFKTVEAKGFPSAECSKLHKDLETLQEDSERLKWDRSRADIKGLGYGNAAGHDIETTEGKAIGRQPTVLDIPEREYKGLWDALQRKQPYRIETKAPFGEGDFSSGGLPPILMPQLTQQLPYEPDDVFDHLIQTAAPAASSVEWLQHTGNTNPAAPTAELTAKPNLDMVLTTHTMPFTKIAALQQFSMESLADFRYFMEFVPGEMFRASRDARTDQVLNGNGTAPNMLGLINTPGVLTRELGSDTPIDCLRKSFNDLRVGSAFATASLVIMNPSDWADVQLEKSSGGLYLLNPTDPNSIGTLTDI